MRCKRLKFLHDWGKWSKPEMHNYSRARTYSDMTVGYSAANIEWSQYEQVRSCKVCGKSRIRVIIR